MREWLGKRYWLVGASEGLGRSLATRLSGAGVELVLSARNEERLQELVAELPGRASYVPLDVSDAASVASAAEEVGDVDGFVYLAGAYWPLSANEWTPEKTGEVEAMIDVNFTGAVRCLPHVLPGMVERGAGHVVLTGSLSGFRGLPGAVGYAASKAALMSLAETVYADMKGTGVEVQCVNPGFIRTRLTDKNDFSMPQIMEPEDAAARMFDHMNTDNFALSFPAPFAWLFRLAPVMPGWMFHRLFR